MVTLLSCRINIEFIVHMIYTTVTWATQNFNKSSLSNSFGLLLLLLLLLLVVFTSKLIIVLKIILRLITNLMRM